MQPLQHLACSNSCCQVAKGLSHLSLVNWCLLSQKELLLVNTIPDGLLNCQLSLNLSYVSVIRFDCHHTSTVPYGLMHCKVYPTPIQTLLLMFNNCQNTCLSSLVTRLLCYPETIAQMMPSISMTMLAKILALLSAFP